MSDWTPEQVTGLVNAILTGVLAIVGAVTAYLMKRQQNRVETKTDEQTSMLSQIKRNVADRLK